MQSSNNIIITGASSGLGAALAEKYAADGVVLGLLGRNQIRLEETAQKCRAQGAIVQIGVLDVRDAEAMQQWLQKFDDEFPVDLLIANAGISGGSGGGNGADLQQTKDIFATNVAGVLHSVAPLLPRFQVRKAGQIGMIASLAGYRGLPSAPAYSASKAAVIAYGDALRGKLARDGVQVSVICPGFIKTPLTDVNPYKMPFLMSAEQAANYIAQGLAAKKGRIVFPWQLRIALSIISAFPSVWSDFLFSGLPEKPSM